MLPNCSSTTVYRSSSSSTTLLRILQSHPQIRLVRSLLLPDFSASAGTSKRHSKFPMSSDLDGMTLEVRTVNLLLETHGGARRRGGATWASPMASITIRNLLLYTTNENWQAVNLKEARDFSNDKKFIYVFKHFSEGAFKDDDGAKRVFLVVSCFLKEFQEKLM
ncbi:hypothetical protein L2E82_48798 [Cichorium intybus]|uniref:Uncharacterized protein n=1 Tax=Cichorium intybus TaxID=13427 RepID=A0ACB8YZV7_CICIN|nr:hypothetical protein L2E82_48798 [Cichorium intybus]